MFAMVSGSLPLVGGSATHGPDAVAAAVAAQATAGLELVTDGGARWPSLPVAVREALDEGDTGADGLLVRAWRETAALPAAVDRTVAAVVPGPYSSSLAAGGAPEAPRLAALLNGELEALAAAGCQLVVVEEPAAVAIGTDEEARAAFREAQLALLGDVPPLHVMLSITGGSAWEAGAETILAAPYRSYLLDLIAGPDNWYLARAVPGDRGIACAALKAPSLEDQAPLLVWAAHYAASMQGRGLGRVGLANASPLGGLAPESAAAAMAALARAAAFAEMEPQEAIEAGLDRRTFAQPRGRGARRGGLPRA
ncbi:MAG TPA: hypothetical protein VFY23_16045 [Candidatus Limnocylindrales bacterium]|nr:hypothetical protein [Candidatus Limnocylindrales bacterium]